MNGSVLQLQAQLHRPAAPGADHQEAPRDRPAVDLLAAPDPLVVPLNQAVGKRFANPDVELTVHSLRPMPNASQMLLELTVKGNERAGSSEQPIPMPSATSTGPRRTGCNWRSSTPGASSSRGSPPGLDSDTSRLTLTLTNLPAGGSIKELRYYTLTRATVNVPFEFSDIPMP